MGGPLSEKKDGRLVNRTLASEEENREIKSGSPKWKLLTGMEKDESTTK